MQEVCWGVLVESMPVGSKGCRTEQTKELNSECSYSKNFSWLHEELLTWDAPEGLL